MVAHADHGGLRRRGLRQPPQRRRLERGRTASRTSSTCSASDSTPRFDKGIALVAVATYVLHLLVLWTLTAAPRQAPGRVDSTTRRRNVWFIAVFVLLTVLHLSVFTGGRMSGRAATAIALSPVW